MIGMDRRTGKPLSGLDHLRQSIEDILATPVGSRRMRPEYGSQIRRFVDLPVNAGWKSAVQAEVARSKRNVSQCASPSARAPVSSAVPSTCP